MRGNAPNCVGMLSRRDGRLRFWLAHALFWRYWRARVNGEIVLTYLAHDPGWETGEYGRDGGAPREE